MVGNVYAPINVPGIRSAFRVLFNPSLILPHYTVPTFNDLPVPLSRAFPKEQNVEIKAVVLDKDNCFAAPQETRIFPEYKVCTCSKLIVFKLQKMGRDIFHGKARLGNM
jgi:hypothetical protein